MKWQPDAFDNADQVHVHRTTCLAFRDPPRVRLKDGEYLFVLWDCLALEKTPVDLVDLPHSVQGEVLDLICTVSGTLGSEPPLLSISINEYLQRRKLTSPVSADSRTG